MITISWYTYDETLTNSIRIIFTIRVYRGVLKNITWHKVNQQYFVMHLHNLSREFQHIAYFANQLSLMVEGGVKRYLNMYCITAYIYVVCT